mgnify:FL=1
MPAFTILWFEDRDRGLDLDSEPDPDLDPDPASDPPAWKKEQTRYVGSLI